MSAVFAASCEALLKYSKDIMFETDRSFKWLKDTKLRYKDYNACFEVCQKQKTLKKCQIPLYSKLAIKIKDTLNNYDPDDSDWIMDGNLSIIYVADNGNEVESLALHISNIYKLCTSKSQRFRFLSLFFDCLEKSIIVTGEDDGLQKILRKLSDTYKNRADRADKEPVKAKKPDEDEEDESNDIMGMIAKTMDNKKTMKKMSNVVSGAVSNLDILSKGGDDFQAALEKGDGKKVSKIVQSGMKNMHKGLMGALNDSEEENDDSSEESDESAEESSASEEVKGKEKEKEKKKK